MNTIQAVVPSAHVNQTTLSSKSGLVRGDYVASAIGVPVTAVHSTFRVRICVGLVAAIVRTTCRSPQVLDAISAVAVCRHAARSKRNMKQGQVLTESLCHTHHQSQRKTARALAQGRFDKLPARHQSQLTPRQERTHAQAHVQIECICSGNFACSLMSQRASRAARASCAACALCAAWSHRRIGAGALRAHVVQQLVSTGPAKTTAQLDSLNDGPTQSDRARPH